MFTKAIILQIFFKLVLVKLVNLQVVSDSIAQMLHVGKQTIIFNQHSLFSLRKQ